MDGLTLSKCSVVGAMQETRKILAESIDKAYADELITKNAMLAVIDGYEKCLNTFLGLERKNDHRSK